jgi:hypothetical protein
VRPAARQTIELAGIGLERTRRGRVGTSGGHWTGRLLAADEAVDRTAEPCRQYQQTTVKPSARDLWAKARLGFRPASLRPPAPDIHQRVEYPYRSGFASECHGGRAERGKVAQQIVPGLVR